MVTPRSKECISVMRPTHAARRWAGLMALLALGCSTECDRLTVRDGNPWIKMDCPEKDVVAVLGTLNGYHQDYKFSCRSSDESYSGTFVVESSGTHLDSYAASCEGDGCCWTQSEGGHDCCFSIDNQEYGDCGGSDTTVVYY